MRNTLRVSAILLLFSLTLQLGAEDNFTSTLPPGPLPAATTSSAPEPAVRRFPALYLVGDSTVRNSTRGQVGWGTPLAGLFDQSRIHVENRALGGRSSRSYLREGLWQKVIEVLKPGDFVLIQFGHNDNGPIAEGKARASLKGNSDDVKEVVLVETGQAETVHSYGWYLRKYIADTKSKGATPIVCSLVPRNIWKEEVVVRGIDSHGGWAAEAARQGGAHFIDLNEIVARRYEKEGKETVGARYFTSADHTHTSADGARLNAECVVEGIKGLKDCGLAGYLVGESKSDPVGLVVPSN